MNATTLTSRERVNRAMEHRDHDRVPRFDQIWPETLARWQSEGLSGDLAAMFGWDIDWLAWLTPTPFPGRSEAIAETDETRDERNAWGASVRVWKNRSGTPEHLGWTCESPEVWRDQFKPHLTLENYPLDLAGINTKLSAARGSGKWACWCGTSTYEALKAMLGDEAMLMAMADEPEWIRDISSTYTDLLLRIYDRLWESGARPDGLWLFEDVAYSNGPLCSPAMYRELIWPDHQRIAAWVHEHNMKMIFHTDGDINSYIPHFIEAGFDCLQPLEAKAKMDIRTLCPQYGDKLAFFGNIDMMVAIGNNREEVEHEVVSKLQAGMSTRGYLFHSDHSVPPQVSWETYQWIMELVERHGYYR